MTRRRVVVTGMGIVSPVGIGLAAAWDAILAARSGIGPITRFDASTFPSRIAGEVKDFDVGKYLSAKEARRYDAFTHYGLVATMEAVADAGLADYAGDKERVGVCIGSGIGGLPMIEETKQHYLDGGLRKISPFFVPGSIINMLVGPGVDPLRLPGPESRDSSAPARRRITASARRRGSSNTATPTSWSPAAPKATVSPLGVGGFCAARALSHAQRRSRDRQPALGHRPRRLRAGRGRRRAGARGVRAREGARRADLLRARRLRDERRRLPHHRAARGRPRRGAQHGECAEECAA